MANLEPSDPKQLAENIQENVGKVLQDPTNLEALSGLVNEASWISQDENKDLRNDVKSELAKIEQTNSALPKINIDSAGGINCVYPYNDVVVGGKHMFQMRGLKAYGSDASDPAKVVDVGSPFSAQT